MLWGVAKNLGTKWSEKRSTINGYPHKFISERESSITMPASGRNADGNEIKKAASYIREVTERVSKILNHITYKNSIQKVINKTQT